MGMRHFTWKLTNVSSRGMVTTADHGPCVSGAHNTIVAARAGKDQMRPAIFAECFYLMI